MDAKFFELDAKMDAVRSKLASFPPNVIKTYQDRLDVSWIFHDNALEGVVLSYSELKAAIDSRIISDVTLIPMYEEVRLHKQALDWVRTEAVSDIFYHQNPDALWSYRTKIDPSYQMGQFPGSQYDGQFQQKSYAVADDGYSGMLQPGTGIERGFDVFRQIDGLPEDQRNDAGTANSGYQLNAAGA